MNPDFFLDITKTLMECFQVNAAGNFECLNVYSHICEMALNNDN